jgi:hypothetical protein
MNPNMDELIAVTKSAYPGAFIMATTHGSYPYKPWIVESGLDMLRVSIDGAFPESYEKYRVGGSLPTALKFLRDIRDEKRRLARHLQVHWKYILFEWNDSDDEMMHAAHLADELDVRLQFVLTHSPGRSRRFEDVSSLNAALTTLSPHVLIDTTFQLKNPAQRNDSVEAVVSDEVTALLSASLDAIRRRDEQSALIAITKAVEYDPGLKFTERFANCSALLKACMPTVVVQAKFPTTLSGLAAVAHELGDHDSSKRLFRRYLMLAVRTNLFKKDFASALRHMVQWLRITISIRTRLREWQRRLIQVGLEYKRLR